MPGRKHWDIDRIRAMVKATRSKEQARIFSFPQTTLEQYVKISIVVPCIPMFIQFTHQQLHLLLNLEKFKIPIKIHTKVAPTYFRSTTIIRELVLSLAKFILKHSVKYVVIYYVVVWQHVSE
jgi:hypothetical protein